MAKDNLRRAITSLTLILLVMGILLIFIKYHDENTLKIGIFYGSNWGVPGTQQYDIFDQTIEKFEAQYKEKNLKVEYVEGIPSDDYSEWLSGAILKGTEPDIYIILDEDFSTLVSLGTLKNLKVLMEKDQDFDASVFYPSAYHSGTYHHGQYALPFECNPTLMFVNKTLLEKEGIAVPKNDWTWNDFYRICRQVVKDSDQDGKIDQFGYFDYTWLQAVYSNGISPFNEEGTQSYFTDNRFMEAINFIKKLESINKNYKVSANDFDLGNVAFRPFTFSDYRTYMPYPWRIKKYSDFEWNCIQMPSGPSGSNIAGMNTLMVGISARTANEKMAWEFLKMLTTDEEIQKLIYKDTSGASALKAVTTSPATMKLLNKDTPGGSKIDLSLLDQVIETAVIPTHFKSYAQAMEKADGLLSSFLQSDEDSSVFMYNLKNEVDTILAP